MNAIAAAVLGFTIGAVTHSWLMERLARRRLRCEVCGSETTPNGHGASSALGSDDDPLMGWGREK